MNRNIIRIKSNLTRRIYLENVNRSRNKLKGKITGIKKFGAFVELPEGKSGLVHISEVADNYVENVEDHLSVGDEVEVKVLSIADDGKISLSIKS